MVQRFLLAVDKATVAVEVPVFLDPQETNAILGRPGGMLGHIDFLQVFEFSVVILDYKPDAAHEKTVIDQLLLYAIALSRRTGIHLRRIQCAWFDENDYYRFPSLQAYHAFKCERGHGSVAGIIRRASNSG